VVTDPTNDPNRVIMGMPETAPGELAGKNLIFTVNPATATIDLHVDIGRIPNDDEMTYLLGVRTQVLQTLMPGSGNDAPPLGFTYHFRCPYCQRKHQADCFVCGGAIDVVVSDPDIAIARLAALLGLSLASIEALDLLPPLARFRLLAETVNGINSALNR
jgi:hypothetical protein